MNLVQNFEIMSSTSKEELMTPIYGKDRESNMEKDLNLRKRGRKDSDVAGTSMKKIKGCIITSSTEPSNMVQEDVNVRKRRAGDDGKKPSKKMRPSEGSMKNCKQQSGKRKANVDKGAPEKKMRWDDSTSIAASGPTIEPSSTGSSTMESSASESSSSGSSASRSSCSESCEKVIGNRWYDDVSHVFNNSSPQEEKIFEMASSGNTSRAEFEDKYLQDAPIGSGGFGSVYAGFRKKDCLPVAIKHIPNDIVRRKRVMCNEKVFDIIVEVAFMLKTSGLPGSVGQSAAISLLDWYTLENELILVLERPPFSLDLQTYLKISGGSLPEHEAKMILKQLVDAAIDIHTKGVFHRDIKLENTLIHWSSIGAPILRVIDFGCGSFSTERSYYSFCGTPAYAPPEWFDCSIYWACPTTVWQLGALFYSLLNRRGHFSTSDFINNHIKIDSTLSQDCKILLHMCLARDPKKRATLQELQCCSALQ